MDHGPYTSYVSKRIRERAYEIFEQRGPLDGDAVLDWLRAEEEIYEEGVRQQKGPARCRDRGEWGQITEASGHDIENPT